MGLFHEFVDDADVRMIGVEAAGFGFDSAMSYLLQDDDGQIIEPHSLSAGLDYPAVGPEHSFLKDMGRAEYYSVTDEEALEAFKRVSRLEGIIPALDVYKMDGNRNRTTNRREQNLNKNLIKKNIPYFF
ncbi:unnamed protein product [Brassica oleracea]